MKCLRCRNETTNNSSFCDKCLQTVAVPLEPSPYLNTNINLNARKKYSATQASAPISGAEKVTKNSWRTAAIFLMLLCLILAAACVWFSHDLWLQYLQ